MSRTAEEEKTHALAMGLFETVLMDMDAEAVDRYVRADYIQHNPIVETGAEGLKRFLEAEKARFGEGGVIHDLKRSFVDGDYVICHYNVRRGEGDPGLAVIDILRFEDGKLAEHWDVIQPVPEQSVNDNGMF